MDDEEVTFRLAAWNENVASGENPVEASHWGCGRSPQNVEVSSMETVEGQIIQEVVAMEEMMQSSNLDQQYIQAEEMSPRSISQSVEQMAAENLIYMAQDGSIGNMMTSIIESQQSVDQIDHHASQYYECEVTEEVITDDWVQTTGQDRVEVIVDQLGVAESADDEIEIDLPTDQDEYTASRPHPCDFCSRRFRSNASLVKHMVTHQDDRPHACNLCGSRYQDKQELMNHLKSHAYAPVEIENQDVHSDMIPSDINEIAEELLMPVKRTQKRAKRRKKQRKASIDDQIMSIEQNEEQIVYENEDDDMRILAEVAEQHLAHQMSLEPRFPVSDPRKPFVCQYCGVGFAREKALASHSRIHGGDSPFECGSCGEMFWDAAALQEHTETKHQIMRSSNSEYEPDNDVSDISDSDSKFGDYYCNTCGMSFHRVDLLRRHARLHVKKEVTDLNDGLMCNVCGETFQEALDLLAHAEVHARSQPHRCFLCGECFENDVNLSDHVQSVHGDSLTPSSCCICGKQCRDRRALRKHSFEHLKPKEHACNKCNKSFNNKARLKRHMESHRNKCVSCDICGEQFADGRALMNHRHSHSTSITGRQFPCRECGKSFGSRSSQQIHLRIHTGERPYGCRYCWKAFADGGTLRKHERIHTGEKPYACAVCPRAFNQRVVLREHIRSHHSGPDKTPDDPRNPYACSVCHSLFSASHDLVQHLIGHSDMNTAMKRQPQVGPRKYKRRRKLKPYEVDRLVRRSEVRAKGPRICDEERESDVWYSDNSQNDEIIPSSTSNSEQTVTSNPPIKKTQSRKQKTIKPASEGGYRSVCDSFETVMESFSSLVKDMKANKNKKKKEIALPAHTRPKMIHTAKSRVEHTVDGKNKTKVLITRTTAHPHQNMFQGERNRPRTKNVSYHVLQPDKLPLAVFPDDQQMQDEIGNILSEHTTPIETNQGDNDTSTVLRSPLKDMKGIEKFNSDLVHDLEQILQSPICSKLSSASNSDLLESKNNSEQFPRVAHRSKRIANKMETRYGGIAKNNLKPQQPARKINLNHTVSVTDFRDVIVKEEIEINDNDVYMFKCEMCSERFSTRADLLVHVSIHI